jgi:hypothetical protein
MEMAARPEVLGPPASKARSRKVSPSPGRMEAAGEDAPVLGNSLEPSAERLRVLSASAGVEAVSGAQSWTAVFGPDCGPGPCSPGTAAAAVNVRHAASATASTTRDRAGRPGRVILSLNYILYILAPGL